MSECTTAITVPTGTDMAAFCKYAKDLMACYPKCYCDDAAYKSAIDTTVKTYSEAPYNCKDIKCGSAAGLRASAFSVFVAAAVALVAAH